MTGCNILEYFVFHTCWWTVNKRSLISSLCLSTSICSFHHCYLCLPRLHENPPLIVPGLHNSTFTESCDAACAERIPGEGGVMPIFIKFSRTGAHHLPSHSVTIFLNFIVFSLETIKNSSRMRQLYAYVANESTLLQKKLKHA